MNGIAMAAREPDQLMDVRVGIVDPVRERLDRLREQLLLCGVGYVRVARSLGAARAVLPSARVDLLMLSAEQADGDAIEFVDDLNAGRVEGVEGGSVTNDFGLSGVELGGFAGDLEELLQESKGARAGPAIVYGERLTHSLIERAQKIGATALSVPTTVPRLTRAVATALGAS